MADQVNLSGATRTNLLALQRTTDLISRTQERLSTGLKVNSAIDDAIAFFQSRSLTGVKEPSKPAEEAFIQSPDGLPGAEEAPALESLTTADTTPFDEARSEQAPFGEVGGRFVRAVETVCRTQEAA